MLLLIGNFESAVIADCLCGEGEKLFNGEVTTDDTTINDVAIALNLIIAHWKVYNNELIELDDKCIEAIMYGLKAHAEWFNKINNSLCLSNAKAIEMIYKNIEEQIVHQGGKLNQ